MIQVVARGNGTPEDVVAVEKELVRLPDAIGGALADAGVLVVACRGSVLGYAPHLAGQRPREWSEGSTWDTVPGCYLPSEKVVVVATVAHEAARRVPPFGVGHGSRSLAVHETLHGYDYARARAASRAAEFRRAWRSDVPVLGTSYFTNPNSGPEESFAESGARHFGLDDAQVHAWPHLRSYWNGDRSRLLSTGPADEPLEEDAGGEQDGLHDGPLGWGRPGPDGSFELFLTARGEQGEIGHGLVVVRPGDPAFEGVSALARRSRERLLTTSAPASADIFDVPTLPGPR
jgi:hypothetical protein